MTVETRWNELLNLVLRANKKTREHVVQSDVAKRLVNDLLATPQSRAFFVSKLTKRDELSRRSSVVSVVVEVVRNPQNTKGWAVRERNELLRHLTELIRQTSVMQDRGKLLWQATAAWCRSKDPLVPQLVGEEIERLAGVQNQNLQAALSESGGWGELTGDEKVDVLVALKEGWPTELRMQAETMITALRSLNSPRATPPQPVIPPPSVAPAVLPVKTKSAEAVLNEPPVPVVGPPLSPPLVEPAENTVEAKSDEAATSEPPDMTCTPVVPPASEHTQASEPTKPPKSTKKKPDPPPEVAPQFAGFKTLVDSLNGLVRGPMTELIEQATKLQQSTAESLRAELDRLRAALDAERELGGEARAEVARLKRELADACERATAADRQLADARGRLADTDERVQRAEERAEQAMLDAEREKAEAVTSFRLPLTDRLRSQLADAADPEYAQQDGTDLEKVLRIRLRRVFEILRAADIDVTPTD